MGVVATGASASSIALSWHEPAYTPATGYNVIEKIWIPALHGGHYVYRPVLSGVTTSSAVVSGLGSGTHHTYLVVAYDATGTSIYSLPAAAETWAAPSLPSASGEVLLSNGYYWIGPVPVTAGMTTQVSLLGGGNPLTYSVVAGPGTASVNSKGVVTFSPTSTELGNIPVTIRVSNALGTASQTITFAVSAAAPNLLTPRLSISPTTTVYDGLSQGVLASAVGVDGKTPVAGSFAIAYNGVPGAGNAGTYQVLATFTSADPKYRSATLLTTYTIARATPAYNYLTSPTITQGDATTTVTGTLGVGGLTVPAGEMIIVSVDGAYGDAVMGINGFFTATFAVSKLAVGTYPISYSYPGDANFKGATGYATARVVPALAPKITLQPTDETVSAPDPAVFTAAASGNPTPSVQWQVSTDGGLTFANITGNTSALTDTLVVGTYTTMDGYEYRAVFSNRVGTATTNAVTLHVQADTGGGGGDS
jgi:hypothetical protein